MRRRAALVIAAVLCGVVAALVSPAVASAEDLARDDPEGAQELVDRHAPVMMLKSQDAPCDDNGEPYGPTSVDIVLDNPDVLLRQVGNFDPVVMRSPAAGDLFGLGEGFFLDFPGGALEPGCIYERDFVAYSAGTPPTVYAHIVQQEDHPDQLALQYWFYWYYNDWNNKHESDWEGIQLLFDASSISEALASDPVSIGYAQHEGGERAGWDDSKLTREDGHPVVFSSAGSHASYYSSAFYLGRSGGEGFGCDNTGGPSDRVEPDVVVLPDDVDDPTDPLAWLAFEGRWGERQRGPFNGPTGPMAKGRWLEPIDWQDDLRSSSVVVPTGESQAESIIVGFCDIVEWGSGILIEFTTSPAKLILTGFALIVLVSWLIRRTDWSLVETTPIVRHRRAGQIIRTAGHSERGSPLGLLTLGLIYVPVGIVVSLGAALLAATPGIHQLLELAGSASGTALAFALVAGSLANLIAYVAVNAMVAAYMRPDPSGGHCTPTDAIRQAWDHRRALAAGLARATAIVIVLMISIVGIPWGIRQVVRYQLLSQAVVLENLDGRDGLHRSSELVIGRWWYTALMVTIFNGLVAVSGMIVGILLLVLIPGIPLWLFSALVPLVYALIVPLVAVAQTMFYGDAVAVNDEAEADQLVSA